MGKLAYIETFGCQMNERDSEIMGQLLATADYAKTGEPDRADLILINTCSIRAKAEQKVYSLLGRLKRQKLAKPSLIIAVTGCVAQQEGHRIPSRMPHVDIVLGTQHVCRLPELVAEVEHSRRPQVAVTLSPSFTIPQIPRIIAAGDISVAPDENTCRRFVTIMQGCNNYCTYCVVPYTRGREVSRPAGDILAEISLLAGSGVKEVTLLGQNVNSYGKVGGTGAGEMDFPDLLRAVTKIAGIERIRFITSNPRDLSEKLMAAFAELDKLCPHFHLPVQSGSNRILKRMNRKYTVESYLEKVVALRGYRPDIALTTDIIVGFPGETDTDFEATMQLLETVRFHSAFSFKYSDRPNARSVSFANKVPEQEKSQRLSKLQTRQDEITLARNREYIGRQETVLVEGDSKAAAGQYRGRTGSNHIVNFNADYLVPPGDLVEVLIKEGLQHSLRGRVLELKKEN